MRENEKKRSRSFGSHFFSERESSFSLEIRAIRPLAIFGARRKADLRGEGFAWVPDLRSLEKLREVGFLPTWFYSLFKNYVDA